MVTRLYLIPRSFIVACTEIVILVRHCVCTVENVTEVDGEVKIEDDSSDTSECSLDYQPHTGMFLGMSSRAVFLHLIAMHDIQV